MFLDVHPLCNLPRFLSSLAKNTKRRLQAQSQSTPPHTCFLQDRRYKIPSHEFYILYKFSKIICQANIIEVQLQSAQEKKDYSQENFLQREIIYILKLLYILNVIDDVFEISFLYYCVRILFFSFIFR